MAGLAESLDVVAPRYEVEQVAAGAFGPPLFGPNDIEAYVGRDAIKEAGRRLVRQAFLPPQQAHEGLLHGVHGLLLVAQEAPAAPEDHGAVFFVESLDVNHRILASS